MAWRPARSRSARGAACSAACCSAHELLPASWPESCGPGAQGPPRARRSLIQRTRCVWRLWVGRAGAVRSSLAAAERGQAARGSRGGEAARLRFSPGRCHAMGRVPRRIERGSFAMHAHTLSRTPSPLRTFVSMLTPGRSFLQQGAWKAARRRQSRQSESPCRCSPRQLSHLAHFGSACSLFPRRTL